MKDWTSIAKAQGVEIPAKDMERIARTLDALDAAFHPLASQLGVEIEPAVTFRAEEDGGDDPGSR